MESWVLADLGFFSVGGGLKYITSPQVVKLRSSAPPLPPVPTPMGWKVFFRKTGGFGSDSPGGRGLTLLLAICFPVTCGRLPVFPLIYNIPKSNGWLRSLLAYLNASSQMAWDIFITPVCRQFQFVRNKLFFRRPYGPAVWSFFRHGPVGPPCVYR